MGFAYQVAHCLLGQAFRGAVRLAPDAVIIDWLRTFALFQDMSPAKARLPTLILISITNAFA